MPSKAPTAPVSYAASNTVPFYGDRITSLDSTPKYSGLGTVEKVNAKTISVALDNGVKVRFPYALVAPAPKDAPAAPTPEAVENTFQTLPLGTIVRFDKPRNAQQTGVFVVIKHGSTLGTVNLAKVGGDNNRYFRSISGKSLIRVDPWDIPQYLTLPASADSVDL